MSTGLLSIGVSGLAAAQLGLLTTEHNVTNASTPGYTRQRTEQTSLVGLATGSGSVGQGTDVVTIERMYDKYLSAQVNTSQTKLSETDAYYAQISQIDNMLADPTSGLTPALQDFFNGVQQVATNPSLLSARQSMISSAETLVSRFNSMQLRLDELGNDVNGRIEDAVSSVNSYATQIAALNQRIVIAESAYGQPANDMLDQRGQLVSELNKLIQVTSSTNSNGSLNLYVGSGQPLVIGTQTMAMTAKASNLDASKVVVGFETAAGNSIELPDNLVVGGELGGLVKFRSETLGQATNELGRMAASVALTFNAQNALGQDLLGQASGDTGFAADFFSMATAQPTVRANASNVGNPSVSAAFAAPTYSAATDGNFYTKLTSSDYRLTNVDGTNYSLTRLSDGKSLLTDTLANVSNYAEANEGFKISIAGLDAAGNSYLIQPTSNAAQNIAVNSIIAADPRAVAAALPFRTNASASNTGSGSISGGTSAPGFDTNLLPAAGIGISFVSGAPNQLNLTDVVAGQKITYKVPGGNEQSTTVLAGAPTSTLINYTQGMTISVSGMNFVMTGTPNNADSFKLQRNAAATTDGRNALALGKLQTQNTVADGRATFQTSFAEMVANVGIKTRELRVIGAVQESALNQSQSARDALSGVNLDEEAANMIRYQQAYQAAAKILDIGSKLFDELLQLG